MSGGACWFTELFDVEAFEVDGCHLDLLIVDRGTGCLAFRPVWNLVLCRFPHCPTLSGSRCRLRSPMRSC